VIAVNFMEILSVLRDVVSAATGSGPESRW